MSLFFFSNFEKLIFSSIIFSYLFLIFKFFIYKKKLWEKLSVLAKDKVKKKVAAKRLNIPMVCAQEVSLF